MAATLVVARGSSLFLLRPDRPPEEFPAERSRGRPATGGPGAERIGQLAQRLDSVSADGALEASGAALARALTTGLGRPVRAAEPAALRDARLRLPAWTARARREFTLAVARDAIDRAFRSPEEIVVSLAREDARFERTVDREERASEAFVPPSDTPLASVAVAWSSVRSQLRSHRQTLRQRLEQSATVLLPNLSAVVGPTVAARLLAAAGGLTALARCSSSRLQLLGVRRRPSPERGPKYGVLYRAECLEDVPADRRAAFARSVASLAVIAARADATSRSPIAPGLIARRDRRARQLREGSR